MTTIHRTASGALNTAYYTRRARRLRARVMRRLWARFSAAVAGSLRTVVTGRWAAHGIRRWLHCEQGRRPMPHSLPGGHLTRPVSKS